MGVAYALVFVLGIGCSGSLHQGALRNNLLLERKICSIKKKIVLIYRKDRVMSNLGNLAQLLLGYY